MSKCLVCFEPLETKPHVGEYHEKCAEHLFGTPKFPSIEYRMSDLDKLAEKVVAKQANVTGVQAKISLSSIMDESGIGRLVINYKGDFILKPPTDKYAGMPEVEAATMCMADISRIEVVPYGLIRMKDGALAYITRRVDRKGGEKIHQEDMCQLTERLTEDKYKSSYEQIGIALDKYSAYPLLNKAIFFQVVLFSFLHGNTDMHLKNFSLTFDNQVKGLLTPAYDLLNTQIILPDREQTALSINRHRTNIIWRDFEALAANLKLSARQVKSVKREMLKARLSYDKVIDNSFMSEEHKEAYKQELKARYKILTQ